MRVIECLLITKRGDLLLPRRFGRGHVAFHYRTLSDELDVGWVKCDRDWQPFVEQMVEER